MEATQHAKEPTAADLGDLLDAGDGAVVTLVAGETRLAAHRAVLERGSPVFAAMFHHDTLEASSGEVAIPDVAGPVLRLLLAFLYCPRVPQLPVAPLLQLLAAADKYGVEVLKEACERQAAAQLTVEVAAAVAVAAIRHSCSALREAAIGFIKSHMLEVMATPGWAEAVHDQPGEVVEISRLLAETSETRTLGGSSTAGQPPSAISPAVAAAASRLRSLDPEEKGRRLREAAKEGAVEELEALLAAGAYVGAAEEGSRWTALHWAAGEGREDAARRLLAAGAAVGARDSGQGTALHWAALGGHTAVVRLLLAAGADPSARDRAEWTPLHCAATDGHREAAAALLEAGADRAARDSDGLTPLDLASRWNHQQVVDLLQGR